MSGTDTAALTQLLARLDTYVAGAAAGPTPLPVPTPDEAMATYRMAAALVERQLTHVERDPHAVALTREVLVGTHRLLRAALDHTETPRRPVLQVLDGGAVPRRMPR